MYKRNPRLGAGCLFIIASLLVFIGGGANLWAASPEVEGTFIFAEPAEYPVIDPQKKGGGGGAFYVYVFQTPVSPSGLDSHLLGDLAKSWETIDPLTWKFNLRKGIKFHNGDLLTAADVQFSAYRQMGKINPKFRSTNTGLWKRLINKVETPDDYTVIIHTNQPDASFLSIMRWLFIVPKNYIEKIGDDAFGKKPVGTGPFKITKRKIGESLTMEAHLDYWNQSPEPGSKGPAKVKTVILRSIPQEQTRMAALKTGEVHGTMIAPDSAAAVSENPNIQLFYTHKNAPIFIMFNWRPPRKSKRAKKAKAPIVEKPNPYMDIRVRRALNYALDVEAVIKNYLTGKEYKTTLVGRGGIGYNPNVPFYEYNPEKARKLLLEAGYPNGFKTKFYVSSDPQPYVEAMLQQWRDIGIQIERVQVSGPVVKKKIIKKTLDGMVGWGAGFGGHDPAATWLQNCVSYKGTWAVHGKNEQVETLVKKQAAEFDQVKRGRIIDEIIQILWRDAWFVPLWESVHIQAIRAEWNYKQMPTQRIIYFSSLSKKR